MPKGKANADAEMNIDGKMNIDGRMNIDGQLNIDAKASVYAKRALKLILSLGILCAMLICAQNVLKLDMGHRGTDNVKGFYDEEDNSIEALFIGPSTMFCTVDPLVLYEDYGIAAYDFGCSMQPFEISLLYMEEALKTQKPKVIAVETLSIFGRAKDGQLENLNYGLTDMPLSMEKAKAVYDIFKDDKGKALSYLFPLAQYKDRWEELTSADFIDRAYNYAKGGYAPDLISDYPLDFSSYYDEQRFEIPKENIEIFWEMKRLCEDNGASLLLFKSPSVGWNIGQTKAVAALAKEAGVDFIDYYSLMDEIGIDVSRDFRDNSHFNRYGSKKASDYMGAYLKEHYGLTDYRGQDKENSWDKALKERDYELKNEALPKISNLAEYMGAIPYEGHTVAFCVSGDVGAGDGMSEDSDDADVSGDGSGGDSDMAKFIRDLAASFGVDGEKLVSGASFAIKDGTLISPLVGQGDKQWLWEQDDCHMRLTGYTITWNKKVYQLVDDGITILVFDNRQGKLVDVAAFSVYDPAHAIRE